MKVSLITVTLLLTFCYTVSAQDMAELCSHNKIQSWQQFAKVTTAAAEEEYYNIKHVHLDIELDNRSVAIKGTCITTAQVTEPNFSLYTFELNKLITVDSVFIDGHGANFQRKDNLVNVFCPVVLQPGDMFTAVVYYQGMPEPGTVFAFQSGMNNAVAAQWNSPVTYTQSQPFNSKDWWPCKQVLTDKIDSADIWITVPDSLMAGSNGLLQRVTQLPGNKARYEWKTNYPMAYYLLSACVGAYDEYTYNTTLPDGTVVPVQNFIYNRPGVLEEYKAGIDTAGMMMSYFSELFGRYPFYREKYGHCMSPLFGGMEHQTMTTQHHFGSRLTAHELAHQWFGNHVTCAGWQDIWLNEGFASYAEYLNAAKYWGEKSAYNYMLGVHDLVFKDTNEIANSSIYKNGSDTENLYIIFNTTITYNKASAVVHTLRYYINNDERFFELLRTYQQQYSMGNASTEDFKQLAESITGVSMDEFFAQWIYGYGYPVYNIKWNQLGSNVWMELQQQTTVEATPLFTTPLEILLSSADGDTTIKIDRHTNTQSLHIVTSKKIDRIIVDPRNMILNKDSVTKDDDMGNNILVYPNPTGNDWKISNLVMDLQLRLTDMSGKMLWQNTTTDNLDVLIQAGTYARGVYLLTITGADNKKGVLKLTKL